MANTRVILKRRKAVRNIHKITRTMNLIATSKFRRAHDRAVDSKPYTQKVTALVSKLADVAGGQIDHPLLRSREVRNDLVLVLTSNRGLCGGYNAQVLRAAIAHIEAQKKAGVNVRLEVVGKKGINYLKFLGYPMAGRFTHIEDKPSFDHVEEFVSRHMDLFLREQSIDAVHVVYMRFVSAGRQQPVVEKLLPLSGLDEVARPAAADGAAKREHPLEAYDFSPAPAELLAELLPITVKVRLLQFLNDSVVSEQIARMTAMKAATDNAGDMIRGLTRKYNRARQSQITSELSEIIGGAAALE
ncbi:MAG: ATP synthase gamma chain [Phycisphaerae bacterium]|nr:ATP synthase gamma chain [Phycisphaerae bacterium]